MAGTAPLRVAAKAWSLARAGPRRQILVIEAVVSLAAARISLALHPFARVAAGLGTFSATAVRSGGSDPSLANTQTAEEVGWAVRATAPWVPFRAVCLQQAIAARAMLRRRGIASILHLGAGTADDAELSAHAWLDAAGARVTGYPIAPHIVEIGSFT